jgi:hypothetical protein
MSNNTNSSYYNQNYTREQVEQVLSIILDCIKQDEFRIEMNENRLENIDFRNYYRLTFFEAKRNPIENSAQ